MTTNFPFFMFVNDSSINIRDAFNSIVTDQKVSRDRLAKELGIDVERLDALLDVTAPDDFEPWVAIHDQIVEVLTHYGVLHDVPRSSGIQANLKIRLTPILSPELVKRSRQRTLGARSSA